MTLSLFGNPDDDQIWREELALGAVVLRGFALPDEAALLAGVKSVVARSPFRHMQTPAGFRMSVAMSSCGDAGWITDATGYRYEESDPEIGAAWPTMPIAFFLLAKTAAARAGFAGFEPDACLINRYEAGARMSLHQDKNEADYAAPVVSVSLWAASSFPVRWSGKVG